MPSPASPQSCKLDDREIQDHGANAAVPRRGGHQTWAEIHTPSGYEELVVYRRSDGAVETARVGSEGGTTAASALEDDGIVKSVVTAPSACTDDAYSLWREYNGELVIESNTIQWYFRDSTAPSYLNRGDLASELARGYENIETSRNDCLLLDEVSASQQYSGYRDVPSRISADQRCTENDGIYMVDFGVIQEVNGILPLALACRYSVHVGQRWEVVDGDIKFNKEYYAWFLGEPEIAGCKDGANNWYSVESVMTHEAGHIFGLGHVSEADHPHLTMSELIGACDESAKTLGKGDVFGLRVLY